MHDRIIINTINANRAEYEAGHLPHTEAGFDAAGNVAGIQGHSQGSVFPIVEYQRGDILLSKAPFAPGCELSASDFAAQRKNSYRLKALEKLADHLGNQIAESDKGRYEGALVKAKVDFGSGFLVHVPNVSAMFSRERYYGKLYRFLFDQIDFLRCKGHCVVASNIFGEIFINGYRWVEDQDEALAIAKAWNGQGIWSCSGKVSIFL